MNFLMKIANNFLLALDKINNALGGFKISGDNAHHKSISDDINTILKQWVGPIMIALGAAGAIYIVVLGVQYAKSESDSKRAEVKSRIVNLVIGVICIFILSVLCIGLRWDKIASVFGYAGA